MYDIRRVQGIESDCQLADEEGRVTLAEVASLDYAVEELAARAQLGNDREARQPRARRQVFVCLRPNVMTVEQERTYS